jgi:site-specific DNA-methyltransferase (adenine-specific)
MQPFYSNMSGSLYNMDCGEWLRGLPDGLAHCCVTSPPYFGLRDYGHDGQIGLEPTPDEYVARLVEVFREVKRVLRDDGTLWLNLGDSYNAAGRAGHGTWQGCKQGTNRASGMGEDNCRPSVASLKEKDLIGIPWRVAFALQADGWYLRQDIIWKKPNPMPESVTDRCTKAHEYIFLLSKSPRYYYDNEAVKEHAVYPTKGTPKSSGLYQEKSGRNDGGTHLSGGFQTGETRNKRSVWTVTPKPFKGAHFATFPPDLIEPCILAGCPAGGIVIEPFNGSGTTPMVAQQHNRMWMACDISQPYCELAIGRLS